MKKENQERLYKIFYGEGETKYITRYLKQDDIIEGCLNESKAMEIFFTDMIMSNDYIKNNIENIDYLVDEYDEEEDTYPEVYQVFLVNNEYNEEITMDAVKKMGNTFYYDNKNGLYILGVCDFGMSRTLIQTNLKVEEN